MGGGVSRFPQTRWSLILEAKASRPPLDELARIYWRPVYAFLRRKWNKSNEEAKDLTQEFFASLCDTSVLTRLSPERGRFRSYVMAALDNFVQSEYRSLTAQKRGGDRVRLEFSDLSESDSADSGSPEQIFLREWARAALSDAVAELEREYRAAGKDKAYELLVARDFGAAADDDISYETLAQRFSLSLPDVTVTLHRARHRLRELVLDRVRDTVATAEEAEAELRELFGRKR